MADRTYALTDAERHCRLDSFAFDDQANATLRVDAEGIHFMYHESIRISLDRECRR
jgi:hypothetical protein